MLHKIAFKWNVYRPLVDHIPACRSVGDVPAQWGVPARGVHLPRGCTFPGVYLPRGSVPKNVRIVPRGCTYPGGVPAKWGVPAQRGVLYLVMKCLTSGGTCPGGTCRGIKVPAQVLPPFKDRQTPVKT